ncbi:putative Ig domain-containing protein [Candidatus Pelagibacter sp.]|nr:putative Ig domain-containing protein [Candidatus Pelagibacter sp.]
MTNYKDIKTIPIENLNDTGVAGSKVAVGSTANRGSTTGDFRFNSTTGLFEGFNGAEYKILNDQPTVQSVDVTEVDSQAGGDQTIIITGENFSLNPTVTFIGNAGTNITPSTVTRDSKTQITTTTARSSFLNAQEPYGVKVVNAGGLSSTLDSQINVDTAPSWVTPSGNIADIDENATGNHATVQATDPDGDTVSYSLLSGSLGGLSLNSSTGVISGDPTDVSADTTNNFTLRATANSKTADRAFNIIVRNIFTGGNQSVSSIETLAQEILLAANTGPTSGGSLTVNGNSLGSYDWYKSTGQTISSFSSGTYFTGTQDTRSAFICFDGNVTLNSGVTFQPSVRKLFTVIYVDGNLTINGTFKMTARGANHSGTTARDIRMIDGTYSGVSNATIPATGGSGAGQKSGTGPGATGGTKTRGSGGGGGGGNSNPGTNGGAGAAGTCFSGGPGGGGSDNATGGTGTANGGRGGLPGGGNAGGGAGNPDGGGNGGYATQNDGTGGTLLIYCTGTLSGSGSAQAKATDSGTPSGGYRGGGGAGGGIVQIFCNSGSISTNVSGGPGTNAASNEDGGAGGSGSAITYTGYAG